MYSRKVVEQTIERAEQALGISLVRYDDGNLEEMNNHFKGLVKSFDKYGRPEKGLESLVRPLTKEEVEYITNERLMVKYDYTYFFSRYVQILVKLPGSPLDGRVARVKEFLPSQQYFHNLIAKEEERQVELFYNGEPVNGIYTCAQKSRQKGFTAYASAAKMQRVLFWADTQSVCASVDQEMVHTLYNYDHTIYDNLPWFLKPGVGFDTKDSHFTFDEMNSVITYFQANQKGGMGTGKGAISFVHLTELGLWESQGGDPKKILFDLQPAILESPTTFVMQESTANGRTNYWYQHCKASWEGRTNYKVMFCPWYVNDTYHRETIPEGWFPAEHTIAMMAAAERTSKAYLGETRTVSLQQAKWWESQWQMAKDKNQLGSFYANYPTTWEEGFMSNSSSAFPVEVITKLREGIGQIYGSYEL